MKTRTLIHSLAPKASFAIAAAAFMLAGSTAQALVIQLGVGNAALAGLPTPFGTATVTRTTATTATVLFQAGSNATNLYTFGGQGAAAVNVNGTAAVSLLTGTTHPTGSGPQLTDAGSGNVSTFGTFNKTFDEFDGVQYSLLSIGFTLTRNDGGTWANDAAVLTPNADGNSVAVHVFAFSNPTDWTSAIVTGFATGGSTNTPTVPDGGATVVLLGLGLGVLAMVRRMLS